METEGRSDADIEQVQAALDKRAAEVTAEKTKKIEVDADQIPEELRHLIAG